MRIALLALAACSSSSPSSTPDAYDTAKCLIAGTYGDLGTKTGTAGTASGAQTLTITLDPGPPGKDDFFLKLVPGKGAFSGGQPAPGTYTLGGADTQFLNCGVCTNIIADISPTTGPSKFYFTDSGTVTITSTSPIAGSAQNLHFVETDLMTGAPIAGGCVATVSAIHFGT